MFLMGVLGRRVWLRCADCGAEASRFGEDEVLSAVAALEEAANG